MQFKQNAKIHIFSHIATIFLPHPSKHLIQKSLTLEYPFTPTT